MTKRPLKERIGVDIGRRVSAEEGIEWAAKNQVYYIDVQTDIAPNALESFDKERCSAVREGCEKHGIHLGLHTLSGVNIAEFSPFCREAVDAYLKAYIDLAAQVKAEWIVVHGGYHFTSCYELRMQTAIDRLRRIRDYAEQHNVLLLLENLNPEPELAEVNYMPNTLEECHTFFKQLHSPHLKWSFTINHAHYIKGVGIEGFIDGMNSDGLNFIDLCREVRVADNNGEYEIHMQPGTGTVDFGAMFQKIEGLGYQGHYTNGFVGLEAMLEGRDYMVDRAKEAGVDIG